MKDDIPGAESAHFDPTLIAAAVKEMADAPEGSTQAQLRTWLSELLTNQTRAPQLTNSRHAVREAFRACLQQAGVTSGKIAELGGPHNSDAEHFPDYEFEWLSLYPEKGRDDVKVCDIGNADHIPDNSYDAIMSVSVMEHVAEPWKAAQHMARILKPGGIVFHSAPFAYFYHGAPADFWRYTPDGFAVLFPTFKPIMAEFYGAGRRRDNRGSAFNPVDRDGGAPFAVDAFGGWRENWITIYAGQKDLDWAAEKKKEAELQVVLDLTRQFFIRGMKLYQAAKIVTVGLRDMELGADGQLQLARNTRGIHVTRKDCVEMYKQRKERGLNFSYNQFAVAKRFEMLLAEVEKRKNGSVLGLIANAVRPKG